MQAQAVHQTAHLLRLGVVAAQQGLDASDRVHDGRVIAAAEVAADKIRKQRAQTVAWIPLQKLEDLVESATRKAKRLGMAVAHPVAASHHHGDHHQHNSNDILAYVSHSPKKPSLPYSRSTGCL